MNYAEEELNEMEAYYPRNRITQHHLVNPKRGDVLTYGYGGKSLSSLYTRQKRPNSQKLRLVENSSLLGR